MVEIRAIIKDITKARQTIKSLGGEEKGEYSFTDTILTGKNTNLDLNKEFVRLRTYESNSWNKNYALVHKKEKKIVLKKDFPNEQAADEFIHTYFKVRPAFEYYRTGEEWQLDDMKIFLEDIKDFKPTIEIQAKKEDIMNDLLSKLDVIEILQENLPATMQKILQ